MKHRLHLIILLLLPLISFAQDGDIDAQVIICSDSRFKCHIINLLPLGPDGTLVEACCHHMVMTSDWDCIDDCKYGQAKKAPNSSSNQQKKESVMLVDGNLLIDGEHVGTLTPNFDRVNAIVKSTSLQHSSFPINHIVKRQVSLDRKTVVIDEEPIGTIPGIPENSIIEVITISRDAILPNDGQRTALKTFPNPVSEIANITIPSTLRAQSLIVYDASGRVCLTATVEENLATMVIPTDGLKTGTYLIQINGLNGSESTKFVKL